MGNYPDTEVYRDPEDMKNIQERTCEPKFGVYNTQLLAEFPVHSEERMQDTWELAKRTARDYLKNSWIPCVMIKCVVDGAHPYRRKAVKLYEKF